MRLALFSILVFSASLIMAQNKDSIVLKHTWMVGGNAKLFVENISGQTGRLIVDVDPQAGYFFTECIAAGLRIPLSFTSDAIRISTSPFIRYYFPTKGQIRPFAELNTGYSWRMIYAYNDEKYNLAETSWLFGSQLGAALFLTHKASIDVFFYYTGQKAKTYNNGQSREGLFYQTFGLGAGFQVYL